MQSTFVERQFEFEVFVSYTVLLYFIVTVVYSQYYKI